MSIETILDDSDAVTFQGGREAVISNPAEFPEVSDAKTRVVKLEEPMGELDRFSDLSRLLIV